MNTHETYMHRCIQLARLAAGRTSPNPMVGAVLVHEDRIIGEGYHEQYGQPHAEVNCLAGVTKENLPLVPDSTLYVSLEPCAHHGKTPPCTDLIIAKRIPRVVIGIADPFPEVNGKGIKRLKDAGIEVTCNVLPAACLELNKRFLCYHTRRRPYVLLKWAQTSDGFIGAADERLLISNDITNRYVHKWRSEEAAILVGANTAQLDNPSLNVRYWKGPNPVRLVADPQLRLPRTLKIFDGAQKTILFNHLEHKDSETVMYYKLRTDAGFVQQVLEACYQMKIQSIMVEGGAKLLHSFIDAGSWDEARVITNRSLRVENGVAAPVLRNGSVLKTEVLLTDTITYFAHDVNPR